MKNAKTGDNEMKIQTQVFLEDTNSLYAEPARWSTKRLKKIVKTKACSVRSGFCNHALYP